MAINQDAIFKKAVNGFAFETGTRGPKDVSYVTCRQNEKKKIKKLLSEGYKVVKYNDFYIVINGITFNGWNEKMIKEQIF